MCHVWTVSVLNQVLVPDSEKGADFFSVARSRLEARWDSVDSVLSGCLTKGTIVSTNTQTRGPLLWLQAQPGADALAMLAAVGVVGEPGSNFGMSDDDSSSFPHSSSSSPYARVNLVQSNSTFSLLLQRLTILCATPADRLHLLVAARAADDRRALGIKHNTRQAAFWA